MSYSTYMDKSKVSIHTIGHSTLSLEDFVSRLKVNNIELLVDIRSFPGSRRFPHFGKEALAESLPTLGIKYLHLPDLGGYRKASKMVGPVNRGWRNVSFKNYADYTLESKYEDGIEKLLSLARQQRVAYCCSEAVCWRCHRLLVSNTLSARGHEVLHIFDENKVEKHSVGKYGAKATVSDGRVTYPEEKSDLAQFTLPGLI